MQHDFECKKCQVKFSVEHEATDITIVQKELTIRCPKCDMKWGDPKAKIEHQLNVVSFSETKSEKQKQALRKENFERSKEAMQMAGAYQATQPREEQVTIEPKYFNDGKQRNPLTLSKKVVESINDKLHQ